ncbi:hypothetical protein, partial [Salmonella enterica]|uniref:hypothetical protein n=1 Tax=Salmonella enterica TaxID=28901 RepID=UPI0021B2D4FD
MLPTDLNTDLSISPMATFSESLPLVTWQVDTLYSKFTSKTAEALSAKQVAGSILASTINEARTGNRLFLVT